MSTSVRRITSFDFEDNEEELDVVGWGHPHELTVANPGLVFTDDPLFQEGKTSCRSVQALSKSAFQTAHFDSLFRRYPLRGISPIRRAGEFVASTYRKGL